MPQFLFLQALARFSNDLKIQVVRHDGIPQFTPSEVRAAEQRDDLAARHSITSSARSRIGVGNTIPSLFAVLRLITSSNFVGNSAGTSAGFEPRNTFATIAAP